MSKIEQFPFYVNYSDVDDYCFFLIDKYGESAKCVEMLDRKFGESISNPNVNADVLLLKIRRFLYDSGFVDEVSTCDEAFASNRRKRGTKNPYVPMSKRLKNE